MIKLVCEYRVLLQIDFQRLTNSILYNKAIIEERLPSNCTFCFIYLNKKTKSQSTKWHENFVWIIFCCFICLFSVMMPKFDSIWSSLSSFFLDSWWVYARLFILQIIWQKITLLNVNTIVQRWSGINITLLINLLKNEN